MRVFLSGPMGSGKSTVAQALGAQLQLPVVDLDAEIARTAGATIPELFRAHGESAFRSLEAATLEEVLQRQHAGIVALGGGAVTSLPLRRHLLSQGVLVTLDASIDELARRVGQGEGRPLLAGDDMKERLRTLRAARAAAYAECHLRIDTEGVTPDAIAARIAAIAQDAPLVVPLGARTYRIEIGLGVRARAAERVLAHAGQSVVLLVSDSEVFPRWGAEIEASLLAAGVRVRSVVLAPGEEAKTLASVESIWNAGLDAGIDRSSLVLGIGGGVIGDLSGFAASTLMRGVRVGHIPTTLLAMVDSAIGGKTGFDTRHGKNLIGAIHQPSFVLSDVDVLGTLPEVERRAGLAEVVKSAWIDGEAAVAQLERDADALLAGEPNATLRAIRMSAGMKARVVAQDEHELGLRAVLNLGHTMGHAIEAAQGYSGLRHGEAVALGMVAAFRLAQRRGRATLVQAQRMTTLLARLGLPVEVDAYFTDEVFGFLTSDKKRTASLLKYVVPGAPGAVAVEALPLSEITRLLRD